MGRKKWKLGKLNKELAAKISERFEIDPFAALLLSQRSLTTENEILEFLSSETELVDPFLLPDMQAAVDRINDAIFSYEKICIYGDYDADGVTSTTLLYSYLEAQGANVTCLLPNRHEDGYGLSMHVVDKIKKMGTDLVITVDNGIAAVAEADYIKELGMDLVITDHHLPGEKLPSCIAVVDPHRMDVDCPFREYAGVGVAFKLACAIEGDPSAVLYDFSYLVALGTVADIVPLIGENRLLVKKGIESLNSFRTPSMEALTDICGLKDKPIASSNISFGIAPRINAAGRMGSAEKALELLLCEEPSVAEELANELNEMNISRHEEENKIIEDCKALLSQNKTLVHNPVLVVYGKGWHEGVLGIIASKLLEKYMRPTIVLCENNGVMKGSARSIEGFSIYDALAATSKYLTLYGGHEQAAGLTMPSENIDEFIAAINEYAYSLPSYFDTYPELYIDCKLNPETVSIDLLSSLKELEPFGAENPSPTFGLFNMIIDNLEYIGENRNHLRITAHKSDKTRRISIMKFHTSSDDFPYEIGDNVDLAVSLDSNVWRGETRLSIILKDIRPANSDDEDYVKSLKIYDLISLGKDLTKDEASYALPSRNLVGGVYSYIRFVQNNSKDGRSHLNLNSSEKILSIIKKEQSDANLCKIYVAINALIEHSLIEITSHNDIVINQGAQKVDLFSAEILKYISSYLGENDILNGGR